MTLTSFLINNLKIDIFIIKKLLDLADVKITDKYYVDFRVDGVRKKSDKMSLEKFI